MNEIFRHLLMLPPQASSLAHRIVLASGVDIVAGARVVNEIVERIAAPRQ